MTNKPTKTKKGYIWVKASKSKKLRRSGAFGYVYQTFYRKGYWRKKK